MSNILKKEHVVEILKGNRNADAWYDAMVDILPKYEITTVNRIAGFLAQCGHESGDFTIMEENLNYTEAGLNKTFGRYFVRVGRDAKPYARKPEKIANLVYGNRMGNGDVESGDGYRFRGRGIIQITGRENYTKFGQSIGKSPEEVIEYVQTIQGSLESACWYWKMRDINAACDANDINRMTRLINGGTNGLADRTTRYAKALRVLGGASTPARTTPTTSSTPTARVIRRGDRGDDVKAVQRALNLSADGIFGLATELGLKAWQARNGLVADGIAGPLTLARLVR